MSDMKRFNALKKVTAKPMTRQEYNDLRGWRLPVDENGSDEGYLTEDINAPSNLEGWDGYISWTPKAMFDDQFYAVDDEPVGVKCTAPADPDHELTEDEVATLASGGSLCDCCEFVQVGGDCPIEEGDEFDFGSALYLLETGKKVARAGWNGKGMHIVYMLPSEFNELSETGGTNKVQHLGYLALKTASGEVVPWTIGQSDALATDWCLA